MQTPNDLHIAGKYVYALPSNQLGIGVFGGFGHNAVTFTKDQERAFQRWLQLKVKDENPIEEAGHRRNLYRTVEHHGLRLMGLLADLSLLEDGEDPVRSLRELLRDSGVDVQWEEEWDEE